MSLVDRNVPEQDIPQYLELSQQARETEVKRIEEENKKIDSENKKAQKEYEDELKKYEESKKAEKTELESLEEKYVKQFADLERQKKEALTASAQQGLSKADLESAQNSIEKQYSVMIENLQREKGQKAEIINFAQQYPGKAPDSAVLKSFLSSSGNLSLVGEQRRYETGREAKAEYDRGTIVQNALTAPKYTPQQQARIEVGYSTYLSGRPTVEMQARASSIKPTPSPVFPFAPKVAQETDQVRGLINVKTVETIYGGRQIETNPRAYVKGLERILNTSTEPIETAPTQEKIYSFQNISQVKDPSAIALLDFQSQLKTKTAPTASVYKGILEEKGLKETLLSKRVVAEYSSKPVKEYSMRDEAFGLGEAKGNKPFYVNPLTGESFDTQTLKGDQKLAESLGYKFEASKPTDKLQGPWSFGFPQNYYVILDAFGVPRTDKSGNPIMVKSEETAKILSERLAQKPSVITVKTPEGGLTITSTPEKEKPLSSSGERFEYFLKNIEEQQIKYAKYTNEPFTGSLTVKAGLETGKDIIGTGAFLDNLVGQVEGVAPKIKPKTWVQIVPGGTQKTREIKIPEILSFNVADDAFSGKFEKIPSTVKAYESKYGQGSSIGALGLALVGLPIKTGGKLLLGGSIAVAKKVLPQSTKLVKKEGIALTTSKGGTRSAVWDASENIITKPKGKVPVPKGETVGFRPQKVEKLEINPYGKKRKIPYALKQAQEKIVSQSTRLKDSFQVLGSKTKRMVNAMNRSPNLTVIEARNVIIPNITKPERTFSKIDAMKVSLGIYTKKTIKPFVRGMGEVWQGNAERVSLTKQRVPKPQTKFGQYLSEQRIQRKIFVQKVKNIKVPELKTPQGFKQAKKGLQGYAFMQKKRFGAFKESLPSKPTLPKISFETKAARKLKVSNQINLFRQKESLQQSKNAMRKVLESPVEKPKEIIRFETKNALDNIKKSLKGVQEPVSDFVSKIKPWQRLDLTKGYKSPVQWGSIVKIEGNSSKQEFISLLKSAWRKESAVAKLKNVKALKAPPGIITSVGFGRKFPTVKELIADTSKPDRLKKLYNVKALKAPPGIITSVGFGRKFPTVKELIADTSKPDRLKKLYNVKALRFLSPIQPRSGYGSRGPTIKELIADTTKPDRLAKIKNVKALRHLPRIQTSVGFGRKFPTVKDLITQGIFKESSVSKIRNPEALRSSPINPNLPTPIIKIPKKQTRLDKIFSEIRQKSTREIPWKLNESDVSKTNYVRSLLKDNEKYRVIGITIGVGSIGLLSTQQEAEALPSPQILVRSGGQVLIQETKPSLLKDISIPYVSTKLFGKPETIKGEEKYRLESKPETKLSTIPKIKLLSTPVLLQTQPQKQQESVKLSTVTRQKLGTPQKLVQRERQKTETIQRQRFVLTPVLKQAQTQAQKLATPSPLRQPTKQTPTFKLKQPIKLVQKYKTPPPKSPPRLLFGFVKDDKKKREPRKFQLGEKADFLGNTSETQVVGMFNRSETTYGQRRISRLLSGDKRVERGGKRTGSRGTAKFIEGSQKDPFGFKYEKKNQKSKFF